MLLLSRDQVRRVDQIAIKEFGIPGAVLMENAGRSVAEETLRLCLEPGARISLYDPDELDPKIESLHVAVLCGGGNNGGDGFVIARHLYNAGANVAIFTAVPTENLSGDAKLHAEIARKLEIQHIDISDESLLKNSDSELQNSTVIIDALLGTGFSGDVRPNIAAIIRRCNALGMQDDRKVVAVDVPSGFDCDSGTPGNATIRADLTVTFVAMKKGFVKMEAKTYTGRVVVAGIGVPTELIDRL
jgi:NAD(P)H-hydrate epimerase